MRRVIINSGRTLALIVLSTFGFLLIITFSTRRSAMEYTARETYDIVSNTNYVVTTEVASMLNDPIVVTLASSPRETHQDAVMISLSEMLSDNSNEIWNSERPKLLVSDRSSETYEAWMLLTQMGYKDIYVLEQESVEKVMIDP